MQPKTQIAPNATIIQIPISNMDLTVCIDSWESANEIYKLDLEESDYQADTWTIYDEEKDNSQIYLLVKSDQLTYEVILHELFHIISYICTSRGIKMRPNHDEPLAYLQAYVGSKILEYLLPPK